MSKDDTNNIKSRDNMPAAGLFESVNSVNDILREEALKSVVSIELNSLGGLTSSRQDPTSESTTVPKPSKPDTRTSSSGSGAFFQQMLATLTAGNKKDGTAKANAPALLASTGAAAASTSKPMSKSAVDDITSSRNWNNLGSHEDVNVDDVFQTQPGSDSLSKGGKKKTKKTDWNAIMLQGLAAAATAERPVEVKPEAPPSTASAAAAAVPVATKSSLLSSKKRARGEKLPAKPVMKKEAVPTGEKNFFEPTDQDVLLGRGGRANNHPGNKKYLEIKDTIQERYMAADKNQKTNIAQELVDIVNKEWKGKFLKLDPLTNQWYEVDNLTARKKCSQTLREINTPEVRAAKRAKYTSN